MLAARTENFLEFSILWSCRNGDVLRPSYYMKDGGLTTEAFGQKHFYYLARNDSNSVCPWSEVRRRAFDPPNNMWDIGDMQGRDGRLRSSYTRLSYFQEFVATRFGKTSVEALGQSKKWIAGMY